METKQLLDELTQKLTDWKIIFQINDQDCYFIYWEWKVKVENETETKTGGEIKIKIPATMIILNFLVDMITKNYITQKWNINVTIFKLQCNKFYVIIYFKRYDE